MQLAGEGLAGNDAVKAKFVNTLRQTQAKSVFAEDLKTIASGYN